MKYIITPVPFLFKNLIFSIVFLSTSLALNAQQTHNIAVSSFQFSPNTLTINAGDQVIWTNTGGSHNVNGTQATFPGNAVSFGNNVSSGWTYSFTFTVPGFYNYHCDPHSSFGMTGTVNVLNPTGIEEAKTPSVHVFPNPASGSVQLLMDANRFNVTDVMMFELFTLEGRSAQRTEILKAAEIFHEIDISTLAKGLYIYSISSNEKEPFRGKLMIQ